MKVGQKSIVRWVAKLVAKDPSRAKQKAGLEPRVLSTDELRQVSGGTGTTGTDSPNKGW